MSEIEEIIHKQKSNMENFKDVFEKINQLETLPWKNDDEKHGAIMALKLLRNYVLNRKV